MSAIDPAVCTICKEPQPKYALDRYSDKFCGLRCAGVSEGLRQAADLAMQYAADTTNIWVALHAQNIAIAIRKVMGGT